MTEINTSEKLKTSNNPQIQKKVEEKIKDLRGLKRYKTTPTEELNSKARSMVAYEMWLKKNLEAVSEVDELTGLPSLRAFNSTLREEINRIRRSKKTSSIIALDVDDLKKLNDTKGHKAGDDHILLVAEALKSIRRETDYVFRLHGDEFAIILPETNTEGAFVMWRESINPEFIQRGISISGGVAELDTKHPQDGLKKADRAMYGAKKHSADTGENLLESYVLDNTNG